MSSTLTSWNLPSVMCMKVGIDPAQVEECVQLDRGLGGPEAGPREHGQAPVDRAGIQCVDGVGESYVQRRVRMEGASASNQPLGEIRLDAPVAALVGPGERRPVDGPAETAMIELGGPGCQTGDNAPQAPAPRDLAERQGAELLGAGEFADAPVPAVALHDPGERGPREKAHELGEECLATIHW